MRQTNGFVSAKLLQYKQQMKELDTFIVPLKTVELAQNDEAVLEIDFEENFNCKAVVGAQPVSHYKQITLFTISFDGSSSQFKNKLTAATIGVFEEKLPLKLFWNFIPTSHGKGGVDGIEAPNIQNLSSFYQLQFLSKQVAGFSSSQDGYRTLKVVHGKMGEKVKLNLK